MPGYVGTILWTSGDTEAYGGDDTTPPFEFQEALNGFPLPIPTTAFALKDGYTTNSVPYVLTTGNVWQAVATVQQTAEDALLAADQAGTLINYHTALDAAPHAGKFVTPGQMTNNTSHVLSQWYAADGSLTQQIVRVGAEIWTNRWTAGLAVAITNGMLGPIRVTANDGSGFLVSGTGRAGGTDDSGGAVIGLSYNATDNKQLWFGAGRCVDGVMSYFTGVRFNGAGVDGWSLENNTTAQLTVGGYDYDLIVPVGVQTQRLRMWDYGTSAYRYMILSNGVFVLQ